MSKSRIRVIVTLLALAFSLTSMSAVTEARDGMPRDGMPKRKVARRNNKRPVKPAQVKTSDTTAVVPPPVKPDQPPAVKKKEGNIFSRSYRTAKNFIGKIVSGPGSNTGPRRRQSEGEAARFGGDY